MEILKELMTVVTKNKVKEIEVIGNQGQNASPTKVMQFYNRLADGQFLTDDDAAQFFYNDVENNKAYLKLKAKFKGQLLNTLFFIDLNKSSYNHHQKAYYNSYREWSAAKILMGKGAHKTAINLFKTLLKRSIKYEFTELAFLVSKELRRYSAVYMGDLQEFNKYNEICSDWREKMILEEKATEYSSILRIHYVNKRETNKEIYGLAKHFERELKISFPFRCKTYRFSLDCYLVFLYKALIVNDYREAIDVCDQAISFFNDTLSYPTNTAISAFNNHKLISYVQLKEYEEAEKIATICLDLIEEGQTNWFAVLESSFFLNMHARNYKKAAEIYLKVTKNKRFKFLNEPNREIWKVHNAYLNFLIESKNLENVVISKKFRLAKFLNEVPLFSKDKRGMNIPILIIHIAFLIHNKKYDEAIERIEAVEKYCSRYLKKANETFRSDCFIKMLLKIPAFGFERNRISKETIELLRKLKSVPIEMANQPYELEIMPYEHIWDYILAGL